MKLTSPLRGKDWILFSAFSVVAIGFWLHEPDAKYKPPRVVVATTYAALATSYDANSIAFEKDNAGKRFLLHGTVRSVIGTANMEDMLIDEPGLNDPVLASFKSDQNLIALRPGDKVSYTCDEFLGASVSDCALNPPS